MQPFSKRLESKDHPLTADLAFSVSIKMNKDQEGTAIVKVNLIPIKPDEWEHYGVSCPAVENEIEISLNTFNADEEFYKFLTNNTQSAQKALDRVAVPVSIAKSAIEGFDNVLHEQGFSYLTV